MELLDGVRDEVVLLLSGLLLTRLLGFYFSTVATFSIVVDVYGIGHFPHVRHRVSCIYFGITPHASLVLIALICFIVSSSTL